MPIFLLWAIVAILFMIGLAGTIIPGLPGIAFIYAGILLYGFSTGFSTIHTFTVIVLGGIAVLAIASDYIGSSLGSRIGGGKRYATAGALIGSVMGVFIAGPVGIMAGAFVGALAGALYEGQHHGKALKIASLSVIGTLGATVVQLLLGLTVSPFTRYSLSPSFETMRSTFTSGASIGNLPDSLSNRSVTDAL